VFHVGDDVTVDIGDGFPTPMVVVSVDGDRRVTVRTLSGRGTMIVPAKFVFPRRSVH
jgi:hypothetical protein